MPVDICSSKRSWSHLLILLQMSAAKATRQGPYPSGSIYHLFSQGHRCTTAPEKKWCVSVSVVDRARVWVTGLQSTHTSMIQQRITLTGLPAEAHCVARSLRMCAFPFVCFVPVWAGAGKKCLIHTLVRCCAQPLCLHCSTHSFEYCLCQVSMPPRAVC